MSRTIRRKNYLGWYQSKKEFEGKNQHFINIGYGIYWYEETWEEYQRSLHTDGTWTYSIPSSWNRLYHTKPRRAKTQIAIQKVYKLIDYEDYVEFPLNKKPQTYYW